MLARNRTPRGRNLPRGVFFHGSFSSSFRGSFLGSFLGSTTIKLFQKLCIYTHNCVSIVIFFIIRVELKLNGNTPRGRNLPRGVFSRNKALYCRLDSNLFNYRL